MEVIYPNDISMVDDTANPMQEAVPAAEFLSGNYFSSFNPSNFLKDKITAVCTFATGNQDGEYCVVIGTKSGKVQLWNIRKDKLFHKDLNAHTNEIKVIVTYVLPNGTRKIITGSLDQKVMIWDFESGAKLSEISCTDVVHCLAVCGVTGKLVIGTADKRLAIYNLNTTTPDPEFENDFKTAHTDLILSLVIITTTTVSSTPNRSHNSSQNSEKTLIVSVGWDKRMLLWDCNGVLLRVFERGHTKSITTVIAHTPKGEEDQREASPILITGSLDKTAIIWDFATRKKVRVLEGHNGKINGIKINDREDDGSPPIVITASEDKTIILWDLISGFRIRTIDHYEPLQTLALLDWPDGIVILSSGDAAEMVIWDLRRNARVKTYETGAVTTIDVYTSPSRGGSKVMIGDVKQNFTIFSIHNPNERFMMPKYHSKRINASVLYLPFPEETSTPIVVSADGHAEIKVWPLKTDVAPDQPQKTYNKHKSMVLTVALYDPTLLGRERERDLLRTKHSKKPLVDIHRPCILSGGGDNSIKLWAFTNPLMNNSKTPTDNDFITEITNAHKKSVRSIVVYHPTDPHEPPLFLSGSYDTTATLWDLETLEPLRSFRNVHTDYVFFTAIYDPKTQYAQTADLPPEKRIPAVITTSYDASFAVWDMFDIESKPAVHVKNAHKDSVTALAVYTPPLGSEEDPIIVTGSIDCLIHLWNLFTGQKIHTLVGHTDRVCYLKVYDPKGVRPVLFSGGDDEQTFLWEDTLYQNSFMPLGQSVLKAFESDLQKTDWPMITEMAETYGASLFIENSNLFMIAVQRERADFLLKFWEYLALTLPTIKIDTVVGVKPQANNNSNNKNNNNKEIIKGQEEIQEEEAERRENGGQLPRPDTKKYDLLSIAIKKCDLVAVRAIVLAWIKNLNQDMDNMLTQRSYHPSYFFPDEALTLLYKDYPSEFLKFIVSLRLVRNNLSLMNGKKKRQYIASPSRYEFRGYDSKVPFYHQVWKDYRNDHVQHDYVAKQQRGFDYLLMQIDLFVIYVIRGIEQFFDVPIEPQPVTSLMVPFKNCDDVAHYLSRFVKVSSQLDDVSIFDSEVGLVFLRYFWHIRGRGVHVLAFMKYMLFFMTFLVCIYSHQPHYGSHPDLIFLSCLCIAFLCGLALKKSFKCGRRLGRFRCIVGLGLRLGYGCDTSAGRACLAITSVLMWFKILYFLRPFSTTGPLVAMILQIVAEIRVFLVVLFCVLAGYAQAFWILSNNDPSLLFGTVSQSFLTSFLYMLGQNVEADFTGTASPYVATVLLVFFLITMMILMLNLLIALMGDVFSKVRAEGTGLWRREQATIITEEFFLYKATKEIPKHILVLKYTSEVGNDDIDYSDEVDYLVETSDLPSFTRFVSKEARKNNEVTNTGKEKEDGGVEKEKTITRKKSVFRQNTPAEK